ncbi:MAG: aminotransferase class I/II-fold pyridoxal phosphate-dependent enzyme [Bdellovibrionota bacterium]
MWNSLNQTGKSLLAQYACAKMLVDIPANFIAEITQNYQDRRDALVKACESVAGLEIFNSAGAFYTIIDLPVDDAESFAKFMLGEFDYENETVFVAPARGFYINPNQALNKARLAFVLKPESLKRAIEVLGEAITKYNS